MAPRAGVAVVRSTGHGRAASVEGSGQADPNHFGATGPDPGMPTLYVTAPAEAAADLASTLVEERLAACVNRVPCRSTYRWEGEVHSEDEVVLFVKTTDRGTGSVVDRVVELHPYDVPCVERFDEDDVVDAYAEWVERAVADG
jgi:periplasmic divalent cation tolerance protein